MSSRLLSAVTLALLLATPSLAFAAGGGEEARHGPNWFLLAIHVLNTAILSAILVKYAGPPMMTFLKDRSEGIRSRITEAESKLAAAEVELDELRGRLGEVDATRDQMVSDARSLAEAEKVRVLERAEASAERVKEEARRVADNEIERARQALQSEAAALATELAADLVRDAMNDDDDKRLVREFTDRIGSGS